MPPPSIRIVQQRGRDDCGWACLAMWLGLRYDELADLAAEAGLHVGDPLVPSDLVRLAACRGVQLHRRIGQASDGREGLLLTPQGIGWHWVIRYGARGVVIDPATGRVVRRDGDTRGWLLLTEASPETSP